MSGAAQDLHFSRRRRASSHRLPFSHALMAALQFVVLDQILYVHIATNSSSACSHWAPFLYVLIAAL